VPTGDGWSYDPLTMRQDKEKVYGRGTADDKGPALAAFYAMRAVRELGVELSKNCKLILGGVRLQRHPPLFCRPSRSAQDAVARCGLPRHQY